MSTLCKLTSLGIQFLLLLQNGLYQHPRPVALGDIKQTKTEMQSYLPLVIQFDAKGIEKEFFLRLQKDGGHDELLKNLGMLQTPSLMELGTIKYPGKPSEPAHTDWGAARALSNRKRLTWETIYKEGEESRRLLVFVGGYESGFRPVFDPITVVLTEADFKIISWDQGGGVEMFGSAQLIRDEKARVLEVKSKGMQAKVWVERYRITADSIEKIDPR